MSKPKEIFELEWIEWIVAFFLGITSSMAATLLYNKFVIKRKILRELN